MRLAVAAVLLVVGAATPSAQAPIQPAPIPHGSGQSVTPSFEGWFRNADGSFSLSFGYFNRNHEQELDIPVGPANRLEPGPPDRGQPTHFLTRRQTGVFTVVVPRDFGAASKLTWTITANGQTVSVPGHLRPEWEIDALKEVTSGNTPPTVTFDAAGGGGQGPGGATATLRAVAAEPAQLRVWVSDDNVRKPGDEGRRGAAPGVTWSKYRGPGEVTFAERSPKIVNGKADTTATFTAPGEYVLRVLAWDSSGAQGPVMAGGFQCCWTTGYLAVSVSAGGRQSTAAK
jgi:hypothetical protein